MNVALCIAVLVEVRKHPGPQTGAVCALQPINQRTDFIQRRRLVIHGYCVPPRRCVLESRTLALSFANVKAKL